MRYPNIAEALNDLLVKAGNNKAALARDLDTNPTSISVWLEGNRCPEMGSLGKIAKESGKTVQWLSGMPELIVAEPQTGYAVSRGYVPVTSPSRTVPVISKAQAGDFGFWEDQGDAAEHIECPADITDPNAFAFQVEGDSMYPRYKHGEYVIVDTTKTVMNNDDVVVKLSDGAVMVKLYKQISGMVFLESYNQAVETIPVLDGDMVKCFKIVCRK